MVKKESEIEEKILSQDKPKEAKQILDEQIHASLKEFNRSQIGLFISAFSAGLEIGFSVLLMGTVYTLYANDFSPERMSFTLSICYPLGFIFVIIGRSELFTEHTALAILPVLNGGVKLINLLVLWGIVYAGNILGGFIFSLLISSIGPKLGFIEISAFTHIAVELVRHDWYTTLFSAIFAGWMMGLLGWLITSAQETLSRIFMIILVTAIIGLAGFHHCIVGSIELFTALLSTNSISAVDYLNTQFWATLGNILGGTIFVAILKFSHVRFE